VIGSKIIYNPIRIDEKQPLYSCQKRQDLLSSELEGNSLELLETTLLPSRRAWIKGKLTQKERTPEEKKD
jgi:hypothetical protein